MKDKVIKVLKVEPKKAPEICLLKNELESLQEAVSVGADYTGLIEIINLDRGVCLLCKWYWYYITYSIKCIILFFKVKQLYTYRKFWFYWWNKEPFGIHQRFYWYRWLSVWKWVICISWNGVLYLQKKRIRRLKNQINFAQASIDSKFKA